jgi:hypothetical protein
MKHDITDSMLVFKDAVRHIWNTYFVKGDSAMSPRIQEDFSKIEQALFCSIVLFPLGILEKNIIYRSRPLPCIKVKPIGMLNEYPIQYGNKDKNGNTIWEPIIYYKNNNEFYFEFFDFFDWNSYGHIDLHFVRGRMPKNDISKIPQLILMEQTYCEFLFDTELT